MYNRIFPSACGLNDHEYCIVDIAAELFSKGYRVFLEYVFYLEEGTRQNRKRLVVDIYAIRDYNEIIIEVGSISPNHFSGETEKEKWNNRLRFLKEQCPKAKVIHVTQWKNWIDNFTLLNYIQEIRFRAWQKKYGEQAMEEMGKSLAKNKSP